MDDSRHNQAGSILRPATLMGTCSAGTTNDRMRSTQHSYKTGIRKDENVKRTQNVKTLSKYSILIYIRN